MENYRKLKRAIIKEELVALTGDFIKAIILNQFLYWCERVKDFDDFIKEEEQRIQKKIDIQPTKGWIYKTAEELSEETMLGLAPNTIRRHIKKLVDMGFLDERQNPALQWDRTKQYRVNLIKIEQELQKLGYTLQEYRKIAFSKMENRNSKMEN